MRLRLTILVLALSSISIGQTLERQDYDFKVKSCKTNSTGNAVNYEGVEINEGARTVTFERMVRRCLVDEKFDIQKIEQTGRSTIVYDLIKDGKYYSMVLLYIDDTFIIEFFRDGTSVNMVLKED